MWAQTLEKKFKAHGVGPEEMPRFRERWDEHTERKDWEWWKNWSKRHSTSDLDEMRAEGVKRLKAVRGTWGDTNHVTREHEKFDKLLGGEASKEDQTPEKLREEADQGREP